MFKKDLYISRRQKLTSAISDGIILIPGNTDVSFNYPANIYTFRQDSTFLYFFGVNQPNLIGIIDANSGEEYMFGNDIDIDDIIWMGNLPTMSDFAKKNGVKNTLPLSKADEFTEKALKQGRKIHFLPTYRAETKLQLQTLLGIPANELNNNVSEKLIKEVVKLRSVKDKYEIKEIEKSIGVAYKMHTKVMRMAKPGIKEQKIYGRMEGIALSGGGPVSFPIILSVNGNILHNHHHNNKLKKGDLLLADAGAESAMNYCSDITRVTPVGGKFSSKQKDIYEAVLKANTEVIKNSKAGIAYKDMHILSAKIIAERLKDIGLMKGNIDDAVAQGAHALFYPHGLGHMMGLDVHDMEGFGENNIGYNDEYKRSEQFGLAYLRMARKLEEGFVMTVEPGIYFIPELIDIWQKENKFTDFINYEKLKDYRTFGGIRIEDDILIEKNGSRLLGKPIPKTVKDVEEMMRK